MGYAAKVAEKIILSGFKIFSDQFAEGFKKNYNEKKHRHLLEYDVQ